MDIVWSSIRSVIETPLIPQEIKDTLFAGIGSGIMVHRWFDHPYLCIGLEYGVLCFYIWSSPWYEVVRVLFLYGTLVWMLPLLFSRLRIGYKRFVQLLLFVIAKMVSIWAWPSPFHREEQMLLYLINRKIDFGIAGFFIYTLFWMHFLHYFLGSPSFFFPFCLWCIPSLVKFPLAIFIANREKKICVLPQVDESRLTEQHPTRYSFPKTRSELMYLVSEYNLPSSLQHLILEFYGPNKVIQKVQHGVTQKLQEATLVTLEDGERHWFFGQNSVIKWQVPVEECATRPQLEVARSMPNKKVGWFKATKEDTVFLPHRFEPLTRNPRIRYTSDLKVEPIPIRNLEHFSYEEEKESQSQSSSSSSSSDEEEEEDEKEKEWEKEKKELLERIQKLEQSLVNRQPTLSQENGQ